MDKWQSFLEMSQQLFSNALDEGWVYSAHMSGK